MREPAWYGVASGQLIDLSVPKSEDIVIQDIAWSLAHINRFNGHLLMPISVARHSIYVANLLPDSLRLAGLLHDAHEAYVGDVVRPVKNFLKNRGADLEDLENLWQREILKKFEVGVLTYSQEHAIREADDIQLAREISYYAPPGPFQKFGEDSLKHRYKVHFEILVPQETNPLQDYEDFLCAFTDFSISPLRRK